MSEEKQTKQPDLRIFSVEGITVIAEVVEERETEYLCKKGMGYKLFIIDGQLDLRVFEYPLGTELGSLFVLRRNHVQAMTPFVSKELKQIYDGFWKIDKTEVIMEEAN